MLVPLSGKAWIDDLDAAVEEGIYRFDAHCKRLLVLGQKSSEHLT